MRIKGTAVIGPRKPCKKRELSRVEKWSENGMERPEARKESKSKKNKKIKKGITEVPIVWGTVRRTPIQQ